MAPWTTQLTNGPFIAFSPLASPDGKRIFFIGRLKGTELVRLDPKSGQWLPVLTDLSAAGLNYSRDGKWMTYVSLPARNCGEVPWMGPSGSNSTSSPLTVFVSGAHWSPDGQQLAFSAADPGKLWRVCVMPAAGGAMKRLTNGESGAPETSIRPGLPDGASLVFGHGVPQPRSDPPDKYHLRIVDVKTGSISILPGSQGLWSPRYSPDGRYIAALQFPGRHPILYDMATHQQINLAPQLAADWPTGRKTASTFISRINMRAVTIAIASASGTTSSIGSQLSTGYDRPRTPDSGLR